MIPIQKDSAGPLRARLKSFMFRFYTKHIYYYNMSNFYSNSQMLVLIVLAFVFLFMLDMKITQVERKNAILLKKTSIEGDEDQSDEKSEEEIQLEIKEDYPEDELEDTNKKHDKK